MKIIKKKIYPCKSFFVQFGAFVQTLLARANLTARQTK